MDAVRAPKPILLLGRDRLWGIGLPLKRLEGFSGSFLLGLLLALARARAEGRILLTRDRELARRGGHDAVLVEERGVMDQLHALARAGLIIPEVRLTRCSLCNTPLRPARPGEITRAKYAPGRGQGRTYYWCVRCRKLYWEGSHGKNLEKRIQEFFLQD